MAKLNETQIRFICNHIVHRKDWSVSRIAIQYGVTTRRVRQLVAQYRRTGICPVPKQPGRKASAPLTAEEKKAIDTVWNETRLGARLLFRELRRRGYRIPHHKLNRYLLDTGRTVPNPRKQRKRSRCRYEREHSLSLIHGDWHRTGENHPYAIVWLDDASRMILSAGEFTEATTEHSIETLREAMLAASGYNSAIREVNIDRGSQFYSNHPDSVSVFQQFLLDSGIRHIPSRRNNPQTNGKVERFWHEYDRHRWRFLSMHEFIVWYNNRMHGALWTDIAERPSEAIVRKLQPESILGMFMEEVECR